MEETVYNVIIQHVSYHFKILQTFFFHPDTSPWQLASCFPPFILGWTPMQLFLSLFLHSSYASSLSLFLLRRALCLGIFPINCSTSAASQIQPTSGYQVNRIYTE